MPVNVTASVTACAAFVATLTPVVGVADAIVCDVVAVADVCIFISP